MATVMFLTADGPSFWEQRAGAWQAAPGPGSGPIWVITDLTEETLVEITVPRIFGADRNRYVQRQLTTRFPESPFCAALSPVASGGLMDRLAPPRQMLTAIEPATRLNAALDGLQNPLAGVWSVSVLLAQMGQAKALPATLLIVLGQGASNIRIVFVKARVPVLTRLVAGTDSVAAQAAEVVRTVRHLENTHVIERGGARLAVLLLGSANSLAPALERERMDAVAPPNALWADQQQGWRDALCRAVRKSPPGQLAPLNLRTSYLSQQVRRYATWATTVCVLVAMAIAAGRLLSIMSERSLHASLATTSGQLAGQIAQLDATLASFGVAPEQLRTVLGLDQTEIASAPQLVAQLGALSQALSRVPEARIQTLHWQLVGNNATPCASDAAPAATAPVEPAPEPTRRVELKLAMVLGAEAGPRQLLQRSMALSEQFRAMPGVQVAQDPISTLREGDLASTVAGQGETQRALAWCLVMPGMASIEAVQGSRP